MVVANAVAALSEMHECDPSAKLFDMNPGTVSKLLTALNECTEWGQIFILDSLALYVPEDQRELQSICERVSPRLQHVNAAVVLSAVKVIMKLLAAMADEDYKQALLTKLAPPLVTLLSSEPEIQYVALRNINLVVQKYNGALVNHMKVRRARARSLSLSRWRMHVCRSASRAPQAFAVLSSNFLWAPRWYTLTTLLTHVPKSRDNRRYFLSSTMTRSTSSWRSWM
jgi:hypothetical protein